MERITPLGAPSFSPPPTPSEPYAPLLTKFARDLAQKPRGTLHPLLGVTVEPNGGVKEIELVFCPGDRHVKKAPLFFDVLSRFQRTRAWEHSVSQPHNKHRLPFQAFSLVDRGKCYSFLILVLGVKLLGLTGSHKGKLAEKLDWILETASKVL